MTLRITGGKIFNNTGAGVTMNSGRLYMQGVLVTSNGICAGLSDHGFWMPAASGNSGPIQITDCTFEGKAAPDTTSSSITSLPTPASPTTCCAGPVSAPSAWPTRPRPPTSLLETSATKPTCAGKRHDHNRANRRLFVTHGLVGLPSNVQITPLSSLPEGGSFFVSNVTATTFTVEIGSAAGGARSFYWSAWFGVQV